MKLTNLLKNITGLPWTFCIHADPQQGHIMGRERLVADLHACAAMSPEQAKANLPLQECSGGFSLGRSALSGSTGLFL